MSDSRPLLRIIGVGSPFGGDQRGWDAIEAMEDARFPGWRVELETCGIPAALASRFEGVDCLVMLDAVRSTCRETPVMAVDWRRLQAADPSAGCHGFSVREALALGEAMGVLPERVLLFGISSDEQLDEADWFPSLMKALDAALNGRPLSAGAEQEECL